jgi:hypothetical protein
MLEITEVSVKLKSMIIWMRTQSDSNRNGNRKKKHVSNCTKDKPYLEIAHKANFVYLGNIIWFTMTVNLYV